ncbi:MAG: LacI family transcriptional regulator [Clostridiales bacterium]|nr:LacI family transcriptional regulator [Clostridiales bacterium]
MTIKDIARMAGVSVSTVSRVLNNHPDVSAPIRAQVLAVVEEYHFIPNSAARNLVRPQRNTIGVITCGSGNPFHAPILEAIEGELEERGYGVCLRQVKREQDELAYAAALERSEKLKGIILLGGRSDFTVEQAAAVTVPFVCCTYENCFGDLPESAYSSVTIDDEKAAFQAVEYLHQMGHSDIALLLPDIHDRSVGELRYRGYCQALEHLDLPLRERLVLECAGYDMNFGYTAVRELLDSGESCTAVLAISDMLALTAIKALHDGGRRVPEDCSVMGLDGLETTEYTLPPLTTLVQPQEELGRTSVRILTQVIEGAGEHQHVLLQPAFRAGGSVAQR